MDLKANVAIRTDIYKFLKARRIRRKGLPKFYYLDGYIHSMIVLPNGLVIDYAILYTTPKDWWRKFSERYSHTTVVYRESVTKQRPVYEQTRFKFKS